MSTLKKASFEGIKDLLDRLVAGEVFYTRGGSSVFYHEAKASPIRYLQASYKVSSPLTVNDLTGYINNLYRLI